MLKDTFIKEKALYKAFAKLQFYENEVKTSKKNTKIGVYGGISLEQLLDVVDYNESERLVWNYIFNLIKKNYEKHTRITNK
jgi:hypothetical protein